MKNKIKKIIALSVLSVSILTLGNVSFANDFYTIDNLISEREVVSLEGKNELLYKEFKNQDEALTFFKDNYKAFIKYLKNNFNLAEISINNWKNYYNIIISNDFPNFKKEQIYARKFFDIFENKYKNNEIKNKLKSLKEIRSVDEYDEELTYLMPSSSNYSNKYQQSNIELDKKTEEMLENSKTKPINMDRSAPTNLPNQKAAIAYAKKYATSRNTSKYYSFSNGDCANFVSQIFEAGGRKQIVYSGGYTKEAGGWWHITNPHRHSYAWSMANTLVHYFGTHMTTKNHKVFSTQINPGSVIAFDDYDDGDWDHVAYVTEADNYTANYNGKIYYDYKVAQHTRDYHEWTSSSNNGWENLENQGARYAIVRD